MKGVTQKKYFLGESFISIVAPKNKILGSSGVQLT